MRTIEDIKTNQNIVVLKIDSKFNDTIKLGEKEFNLDVTFEKEKHSVVNGCVIKKPSSLFYTSRLGEGGLDYNVPLEIENGDNVFFHYLEVSNAETEGRLREINGEYYLFVQYDRLYCGERKGKVFGLNGWVLSLPVEDNDPIQQYLPESLKNEHSIDVSKVEYLGAPIKQYKTEKFWGEEIDTIKKGDTIVFSPHSDIPLEYKLHESIKGGKYFRMQRKDIIGTLS